MKTKSTPRLLRFALTGLCLLPAGLTATEKKPEEDRPGGAKPFVLFMGADLAVQRENKFHQVEDVVGSEFKIRIGKRDFFVPTRHRQTSLKVNNSLKLSGANVRLDGLQSGPAYTYANDPMTKFVAASGASGGAAAVQDLAYGKMIESEIVLAAATNSLAQTPENSPSRGMVEAAFKRATEKYSADTALAVMSNDIPLSAEFNTPEHAYRMQLQRDEGNHDAMEVSFKVSSPVELEDPYMVVLFKFQAREAKPGEEGMLIHAASLDPIGPSPKYIRVREAGLPVGFKYLDCEVHIYNRGEEVATNLSPKRVELTRGEAQEYLVIEHLGTNKGATVPAVAVPGTLSRERRQGLSPVQLDRTFYAQVSTEGALLGAYADESCHLRLDDPATVALLGEVFFKPALYKGKPVTGTARVRLADLMP